MATTPNYALNLPIVGADLDAWGDDTNANWSSVDTIMKTNADAAAAAQTAANAAQATATAAVPSVFGRTGAIIAVSGDYNLSKLPDVVTALGLKSDKGILDGLTSYAASSNFALADAGALVQVGASGNIIMTVVAQVTTAWLDRTRMDIVRIGAGEVSIAAASGVTILSAGGKLRLNVQYSGATLIRTNTVNLWYLVGDLKV